nr:zinc finger, CCHC-type [Tanacetum cinerariifolium]GEZ63270.1 zinc finger, CCHC-type [Tanacetum cinerariifolium]
MTTSSTNNSVFKGFFEKQKLIEPKFIDWYRQLRIMLSIEDKLNYLEQPIPHVPVAPAGQQVASKILTAHTAWEEGQSVSSYVLKMKGYIDNLERLGHPVTLGLGVSLILIGLRNEYDGCVQNYNMHRMGKTVNELHAMLKLYEQTLPKSNAPALNAIRAGKGLRASKKLKPRALSLYMGNGQCEAVEAIGAFYLCLPSGLDIVLNNCHYAPSIIRGVISVSRLDGIFEIDLSNSLTNESSVYAVRNKRAKLDLDSALLWHCRLRHISKKRIKKLQHDGLLNSSDLTAFEKCVFCMSGKMARKPYTYQVERAKDLLGLIHTDNIQEEDTHPSLDTSLNHKEEDLEIDEPQSDIVPIRRSTRTRHAPDRMCLYIDAEEHELRDLGEPANYKAALLDSDIPMLQSVKTYLGKCFAMKDLGEAVYILEIKIYQDRSKRLIGLCQSAYIEKILKRYYTENSKRGSIPMQENLKLSKSQCASTPAEMKRMQNVPYASAVGSIIGDLKQELKVRKFISGLSVVPTIEEPISMYCDNIGAIAFANESGITKGARHFCNKVRYLREVIEFGDIKLKKVHIDDNLADPFTKALAFPKHSKHTKN